MKAKHLRDPMSSQFIMRNVASRKAFIWEHHFHGRIARTASSCAGLFRYHDRAWRTPWIYARAPACAESWPCTVGQGLNPASLGVTASHWSASMDCEWGGRDESPTPPSHALPSPP
jgi:hypothetical protein